MHGEKELERRRKLKRKREEETKGDRKKIIIESLREGDQTKRHKSDRKK